MKVSSSTQSSGGKPPCDWPRDIEPRLAWNRTPTSFAAWIWQSTLFPFLKTYVWSKTVVHPESASSANPISVLDREACSVVRAQIRYWACSHGKRLLFCAATRFRVRVWLEG